MELHLKRHSIEFTEGGAAIALELHLMEKVENKKEKSEERWQGGKKCDYWVGVQGAVRCVHLRPRRALFTPVDVDAARCPRTWTAMPPFRKEQPVT